MRSIWSLSLMGLWCLFSSKRCQTILWCHKACTHCSDGQLWIWLIEGHPPEQWVQLSIVRSQHSFWKQASKYLETYRCPVLALGLYKDPCKPQHFHWCLSAPIDFPLMGLSEGKASVVSPLRGTLKSHFSNAMWQAWRSSGLGILWLSRCGKGEGILWQL